MGTKARILVVDDNEDVRCLLVELLRTEGYQVWEAVNGVTGLKEAQERLPDLVLLDIMMPDLSGFEVCRRIKGDKALSDTFVVLVSGRSTDKTPESWGMDTGADDYIAKPIQPHEFLSRVRFILRLRDTTVALRSALEFNEAIMEASSVGILAYRASGPCVFANNAAAAITGESNSALRESSFRQSSWWTRSDLLSMAEKAIATGKVQVGEVSVRWSYGAESWLDCHVDCFSRAGEMHVLLILNEITERKRMEQELRSLPARILAAQEAERHRVARDLHDSVNQMLASVKMRLRKVMEESASMLKPSAREILARCDNLLVRSLEENRRIAHNLRPSELDQFGLADACKSFCAQFASRTGRELEASISRSKKRFPPEVELHLFRILQEALNNVEKHSGATRVWVRLDVQLRFITLSVIDDGKGFDATASSSRRQGGAGLGNMRERATALGAQYEIGAVQGHGTTITVVVPLPKRQRGLKTAAQQRPVSTQQTA